MIIPQKNYHDHRSSRIKRLSKIVESRSGQGRGQVQSYDWSCNEGLKFEHV